ncbi:MAG: site-2 protease family protein [Planctomycetes bacterium]|nr:site-2 protease family protein [Planctomycetota bacterium]
MEPATLVVIGIVVMSITTHEVAHAWAAYRLGDDTAQRMGRLTLNPLVHIDPFMTVILPGLLLLSGSPVVFGGAKPVPFNPFMLKKVKRDVALVAAAGPLSNILIGFALLGILAGFLHFGIWTSSSSGCKILWGGAVINLFLAVFNLLPIPPLDGSKVLQYFLRGDIRTKYLRLESMGFFLILGLLILDRSILHTGMFSKLINMTVIPMVEGFVEILGLSSYYTHEWWDVIS